MMDRWSGGQVVEHGASGRTEDLKTEVGANVTIGGKKGVFTTSHQERSGPRACNFSAPAV
jgi:hypothetical protein